MNIVSSGRRLIVPWEMANEKTAHDMKAQIRALQLCLTADKRPLGFLLGAGCPLAIRVGVAGSDTPLIPDIKGLTALVRGKLDTDDEHKTVLSALDTACKEDGIVTPTVEDCLNRLGHAYLMWNWLFVSVGKW